MPEVHTFRASTMREALARIQQELDDDAVILQSNSVPTLWLLRRRDEMGVNSADVKNISPLFGQGPAGRQEDADMKVLAFSASERLSAQSPLVGSSRCNASSAECRDSMKILLAQSGQTDTGCGVTEIPAHLSHRYARLGEATGSQATALDLVQYGQGGSRMSEQSDDRREHCLLGEWIRSEFVCEARLPFTDRFNLGLVTLNTYRVVAREQLQAYPELIGFPMQVIAGPLGWRRAIENSSNRNSDLIDRGGRSSMDEPMVQKWEATLVAAEIDEALPPIGLVRKLLSANLTAERSAVVEITSGVPTRLNDEVGIRSFPSITQLVDPPVVGFTTGQDFPDEIEVADPDDLACFSPAEDEAYRHSLA